MKQICNPVVFTSIGLSCSVHPKKLQVLSASTSTCPHPCIVLILTTLPSPSPFTILWSRSGALASKEMATLQEILSRVKFQPKTKNPHHFFNSDFNCIISIKQDFAKKNAKINIRKTEDARRIKAVNPWKVYMLPICQPLSICNYSMHQLSTHFPKEVYVLLKIKENSYKLMNIPFHFQVNKLF